MSLKKLVLIPLLLLSLTLTACAKPVSPEDAAKKDTVNSDAYHAFSANLFTHATSDTTENSIISPASAYFVLAMLENGADNETAAEFEKVMGLPSDTLNAYCQNMTQNLQKTEGDTALNIAHSIWLNTGYAPKKSFIKTITAPYGAEVFEKNLATAKDPINAWVSDQTKALIPEFLTQNPKEGTQMMLINALYLKASWMKPFAPENTHNRDFKCTDGTAVSVPFLNSTTDVQPFIDTADTEGIILPYNDNKLAFVALRPKNNRPINDFIRNFKADTLKNTLATAEDAPVNLSMPKFTREYTFDMKKSLIDMGLDHAFDKNLADFSKMTDANDLFISEALQKSKINIDENGTEAAAASVIAMEMKAMPAPPENVKNLTLDSPYAYFIIRLEGNEPLFMGVMNNPKN
ncbi:MAG: serpin family protein [Eubacterium sp.]